LIDAGKDAATNKAAEFICNNYVEAHLAKMESSKNGIDVKLSDFDFTGISGIVDNCKKDQNIENNRIACSKSVLATIDLVDPTGITALGAAFL